MTVYGAIAAAIIAFAMVECTRQICGAVVTAAAVKLVDKDELMKIVRASRK